MGVAAPAEFLEDDEASPTLGLCFRIGPEFQQLTDDEYFELCRANGDWRIERTSQGEIIVMPPTGGRTGRINFEFAGLFREWVHRDGTGVAFDSSTEFRLPNRAARSPDLSWLRRERWEGLTREEQDKFPPLCPDFVVEIRSPSDRLRALRAKMREYIANGATLGWLIDPVDRRVYVYEPPDRESRLDDPDSVSGEPLLRGFVLEPRRLWL